MAHKFRMVSPTLDRSAKWWALPDDSCRLTYDWLLWSRHSSPIGIFPMPPAFVQAGLKCDEAEASRRLSHLERVGLVERDNEDMLRMIGWFKSAGGANAPSTFTMHCRLFRDRTEVRDSQMRSNGVFEMLFYNLQASENWKQSGEQFVQAMDAATKLAKTEIQRRPDLTAAAIHHHGISADHAITGTNWGMVYQTIRGMVPPTAPPPCGAIESENDMEMEMENDITEPPDRPDGPDTIQNDISDLKKKAASSEI